MSKKVYETPNIAVCYLEIEDAVLAGSGFGDNISAGDDNLSGSKDDGLGW